MFRILPAVKKTTIRALTQLNSKPIPFFMTKVPSYRHFSTEKKLLKLIEAVRDSDHKAITIFAKEDPGIILAQTSDDNTPAHEAAKNGNVQMLKALAQQFPKDFNVNRRCHCRLKRTLLHYAVEFNHVAATETLFEMGAKPNIQDEEGRTAFDYALKNNNVAIAALIKQHGGKANKVKNSELMPRISAHLFAKKYSKSTAETKDQDFKEWMTLLSSNKK